MKRSVIEAEAIRQGQDPRAGLDATTDVQWKINFIQWYSLVQ